jgi:hypothetical protein
MASKIAALICRISWPRRGGLCPECGARVVPPPPLPDLPWETVVRCENGCGWAGSFFHILKLRNQPATVPGGLARTRNTASGGLASLPLPEGSRIVHGGGVEEIWSLPASGKSGGFLWMGVLWMLISVPVAVMLWKRRLGGDEIVWEIVSRCIFGIGFPLIGLSLIYWGLRAKYARHWLTLDSEYVRLERELFGRRKKKALRRPTLTKVEQKEFYSKNYQPVYGIEIRGADGKLRFGSTLTNEEKAWLEHDVRRALGWTETAAVAAPGTAGDGATTPPAPLSAPLPHTAALEIERTGRAVTLRLTPKKSSLTVLGIGFMLFALLFLGVVALLYSDKPWDGDLFDYVSAIFSLPFLIVPLIFLTAGFVGWREGRRLSGTVTVLHTSDTALTLEKIHRGRSTVQQWRRPEVERVQTGISGSHNNVPVHHGEIVAGDRVIMFGMGSAIEDLEAMVSEVRRTLWPEGRTPGE